MFDLGFGVSDFMNVGGPGSGRKPGSKNKDRRDRGETDGRRSNEKGSDDRDDDTGRRGGRPRMGGNE